MYQDQNQNQGGWGQPTMNQGGYQKRQDVMTSVKVSNQPGGNQ